MKRESPRTGIGGGDIVAGTMLAAIGIPEQMATAQLAGLAPEIGLVAFVAAAVGFALFGFRRVISVGADSTIAPIFAAGLAAMAAAGSPQYASLAVLLALLVGAILLAAGRLGLGWIADLFSVPVTTGFLAGIAGHIVVLQLPVLLGIPAESGSLLHRLGQLAGNLTAIDPRSTSIGFGVLLITAVAERISPRIPGALLGLALAAAAMVLFKSELGGVAVLGAVHMHLPRFALPSLPLETVAHLVVLGLVVSIVVMLQTAAVVRSFGSVSDSVDDVSRTFTGLGAANLLSALAGAIPVNASPPRTAVIRESGATTQLSSLLAATLALLLGVFGSALLGLVPNAALAGILLFIAIRILRFSTALDIFRHSTAEFLLIIATMAAILLLPTETGVATGIILSLLHGMWTASRTRIIELERVSGTTVWWPPTKQQTSEKVEDVIVLAFQAPLSFLNAYEFRRGILDAIASRAPRSIRALVLEANGIAEIDYTAAQILKSIIQMCHKSGIGFAVARLESVRARDALARFGLDQLLGQDRFFLTVEESVKKLTAPAAAGNPD